MRPNTHSSINAMLCGSILELSESRSRIQLDLTPTMQADSYGLVHGGFIFGAADYAAMLAINAPTVVLASADVKFLLPARVGERIIFDAEIQDQTARKITVTVTGASDDTLCFEGMFTCVIPSRHVLDK